MTVLVTGGAGFIGSHVVKELLKLQHKVVVLDDLSGGYIENVASGAFFIKGSIVDNNLVVQLFNTYQFEYIFHCAAYAAEVLSHHIRRFNYQNNVIGSVNLINAAVNHDIKCFVFTSSAAIYGNKEIQCREDSVPSPIDPYGISKLAVELDLRAAQELFDLPYVIFRLHNVYGEHQNINDKYRNVVGIFMNQLLQGKPLTIFGDGTQTRSFSYIKDIAPVIVGAINNTKAYNQIFNLGASKTVSLNELASTIVSVTGKEANIRYLSTRHEVKHISVSHEKVKSFFGQLKETPLETGLKEMFEWITQYAGHLPKDFKDIEITRRLPDTWVSTDKSG